MILPFMLFAQEERKFFGFQFALGTGYTFYGDGDISGNVNRTMDRGYCRLILYADAGMTFKITQSLFFLLGAQTMGDFIWKSGDYSHHASPAFFGGIQFYPGIGNLSFSLAYALGFRRDWEKLDAAYNQNTRTAKWGNGFRISAEYDFKKSGVVPAIGASYLFMPTGFDNYDNSLALYFRLALR